MTDAITQSSSDRIAQLTTGAHRHEFVQLVRMLEQLLVLDGSETRGMVGTDAMPGVEPLRFAAAASLGFAPSQVQSIRAPASGSPLEIVVNFLGLIGPAGALPRHYTATAISRAREKDESLVRLLDLFHSRLLGLFYRAFSRYNSAPAFEARHRRPDLLTIALRTAVGFEEAGPLRGLLGATVAERDILGFAGLYAQSHRGAAALEQMLAAQLRLPVKIEQFAGQWLSVPPDQRSRMPGKRGIGAIHNKLGANTVLGSRVWDASSRIGIKIGPLDFDQYVSFITGGDGLRRVGLLSRMYVRKELDIAARPVLKKESVPTWKLESKATRPQLLGRTIWLRSPEKPFAINFDAATYAPPE